MSFAVFKLLIELGLSLIVQVGILELFHVTDPDCTIQNVTLLLYGLAHALTYGQGMRAVTILDYFGPGSLHFIMHIHLVVGVRKQLLRPQRYMVLVLKLLFIDDEGWCNIGCMGHDLIRVLNTHNLVHSVA